MFKIGDKVKWVSSSNGSTTQKVGEVVSVLKPGTYFDSLELCRELNCTSAYGGGASRNHESYAVLVPHRSKGKGVLYWPRVTALTRA